MQSAVLGSRTSGSDSVSYHVSRVKLTSDAEVEKANRFLQEEFATLESKQEEIEQHRRQVTDTAARLDQERQAIAVSSKQTHRQQLQDERTRWELALETAARLNAEFIDE